MMRQRERKSGFAYLWLSIVGYLCMSISFLLMPIDGMHVVPGLLFWGGLVIGVVFQIVLEVRRRAFFARYSVKREKMQKPRNGLLTFGSNRVAIIADCLLAIGVVASVLVFLLTKGYGYWCYACIAVVLFLVCLHCILNGRNYFHVNNQSKVRQSLEQKKANFIDKGESTK